MDTLLGFLVGEILRIVSLVSKKTKTKKKLGFFYFSKKNKFRKKNP